MQNRAFSRFLKGSVNEIALYCIILLTPLRKGVSRRLVPTNASVGRSGVVFRWFSLLDLGRLSRNAGTMPRAMRVEFPGAIYYVMDRGDRRELGGRLRRSGMFIVSAPKQTRLSPHRGGLVRFGEVDA